MKKLLVVVIFFFATQFSLFADIPYIVNFKQILNQSDAGKKAQSFLKNKLESGIKNLQDKEKKILEEEKKLIQQKKLISNEDYKKKVTSLRAKVTNLQKERNDLLQTVAKQRAKAKNELLKNLNPIVKDYMSEKKIKMVIDRKNILLADESLDITNDIMKLLNKKLKKINLN